MVNTFLCVTSASQPAKMTRITFLLLAFVALVNSTGIGKHISIHTGCPKKIVFCGKTAITTFRLIQNAKTESVLENSGYLLPDGH